MHRSLATTFSILVLLKHLFAPLAPLVAAYLMKAHCLHCPDCPSTPSKKPWWTRPRLWNFLQLCLIAAAALSAAFLPFLIIIAPASEPAVSVLHSLKSVELLTFEAQDGGGRGRQLQMLLPFVPVKCILDWEYSMGE